MEIDGAGAVVFGGASGLGAAAAESLAMAGAKVVVADLAVEESGSGSRPTNLNLTADVTDARSVEVALERASAFAGPPRLVVNCAGIATPCKLLDGDRAAPPEAFSEVLGVNLLGSVNVLRLGAAAIASGGRGIDGERGVCINTSSIAAFDGQVGQVAYAASKAGVAGLTLPAARELAPLGVRVVAIAPGLFNTPLLAGLPAAAREKLSAAIPFPPRLGRPAEFGSLVVQIATNSMLNGEVIRLDGALRMGAR